jgi:hypothetical protein
MSIIAEAASASPLQWWQIATGVLGIPTAVVALVYGIIQIQKTRAEIRKTHVDIDKTRLETTKLTGELSNQRRELDEMTEFLYDNFVNDAELRLEGLDSAKPYPFNRASYSDAELRRLRALRLILIRTTVTNLPQHVADLHDHVDITERGRDYLGRRRKRAAKQAT